MSQDEDERQPDFKVNDRRRFDAAGNERDDPGDDAPAFELDPSSAASATDPRALPEIDFSTFVLSLGTSTMVHLGEAPEPDGTKRTDLELARQSIDILGMLKDKTRGNLSPEEGQLLDDLLYDLRLRFVAASQQ